MLFSLYTNTVTVHMSVMAIVKTLLIYLEKKKKKQKKLTKNKQSNN